MVEITRAMAVAWMRALLVDGCLEGEACRGSTCRDLYPQQFEKRDAGGRLVNQWCFVCVHREQLEALVEG